MSKTYKTPGRQRLLEFLQSQPDRQFTADELADELNRAGESGQTNAASCRKSTLYRHLSELCVDGTVRKYRSDTQSAYVYQYVGGGECCHHFHLKCLACGTLLHLECAVSEELLSHIQSDHHFRVDSGRSILYGLCDACALTAEQQNDRHPCGCRRCDGHHHQ